MDAYKYLVRNKIRLANSTSNNVKFRWPEQIMKDKEGSCSEFAMMICKSHLDNNYKSVIISIGVQIYPSYKRGHIISATLIDNTWVIENYVDVGTHFRIKYTSNLVESIKLHMIKFIPMMIDHVVSDDIDKSKLTRYYGIADTDTVINVINNYYGLNVSQKFILNKLGLY